MAAEELDPSLSPVVTMIEGAGGQKQRSLLHPLWLHGKLTWAAYEPMRRAIGVTKSYTPGYCGAIPVDWSVGNSRDKVIASSLEADHKRPRKLFGVSLGGFVGLAAGVSIAKQHPNTSVDVICAASPFGGLSFRGRIASKVFDKVNEHIIAEADRLFGDAADCPNLTVVQMGVQHDLFTKPESTLRRFDKSNRVLLTSKPGDESIDPEVWQVKADVPAVPHVTMIWNEVYLELCKNMARDTDDFLNLAKAAAKAALQPELIEPLPVAHSNYAA